MHAARILSITTALGLTACFTEETACPAGHVRMRGLCVQVDDDSTNDGGALNEAGRPDARITGRDSGTDSGQDDLDATSITPAACYLDWDHDGAGAGDPVDCDDPYAGLPDSSTLDAGTDTDATVDDAPATDGGAATAPVLPAVVDRNDDCDDHDPKRAPTVQEICDGIDNNCNGEVDENARNACGGTCTRVLELEPGSSCDNGQQGACARTGTYVCRGDAEVVCSAPEGTPSSEVCGDKVDNDCDGLVDEPDAVDALTWYQDCDGDGYAASVSGAVKSCAKPNPVGTCGWTSLFPDASTRTNWDCNDSSAAYRPSAGFGAPPQGYTSWDLNCDGTGELDPSFVATPRPCMTTVAEYYNGISSSAARCDLTTFPTVSGARTTSCYLWKDASGKYVRIPTHGCPDEPYLVSFDPWFESCYLDPKPRPALWHCR